MVPCPPHPSREPVPTAVPCTWGSHPVSRDHGQRHGCRTPGRAAIDHETQPCSQAAICSVAPGLHGRSVRGTWPPRHAVLDDSPVPQKALLLLFTLGRATTGEVTSQRRHHDNIQQSRRPGLGGGLSAQRGGPRLGSNHGTTLSAVLASLGRERQKALGMLRTGPIATEAGAGGKWTVSAKGLTQGPVLWACPLHSRMAQV